VVWRAAPRMRRAAGRRQPRRLNRLRRCAAGQAAGGRGRGRKRKGTVVQRLARKLLSGRARDAATGEMLEAETAAQAALHSNRWEER